MFIIVIIFIIIIIIINYYYYYYCYYSARSCGTKEPWKAMALNRWIVMEMR